MQTIQKPINSKIATHLACRPRLVSRSRRGSVCQARRHIAVWALALGLFVGASTSHATTLIWTNGSGNFATAEKWDPAQAPAAGDSTTFTNDTSYTVNFTANSPALVSSIFTGQTGVVTLDIGTSTWSLTNFSLAVYNSTTTVYLASGTLAITNTAHTGQIGRASCRERV